MSSGLDGRVSRKHGIFQPISGAQQMARDGNHQPWENPKSARANRNRVQLGRSPQRVLLWRRALLWWFEAWRKYARPINRNDEVPRPKPPWPPIYFIMDQIKQKTGRSRNEGNYQATSVEDLRTLQGGKDTRGMDTTTNQPDWSMRYYRCWIVARMGASQAEKRRQEKGWLAKLTPGAPISVQRRGGTVPRVCDCMLGAREWLRVYRSGWSLLWKLSGPQTD